MMAKRAREYRVGSPSYNGRRPRRCMSCGRLTLRWQSRNRRWRCVTHSCGHVDARNSDRTGAVARRAVRPTRLVRSEDFGDTGNQATARRAEDYLLRRGYEKPTLDDKEEARRLGVRRGSFDLVCRRHRRNIFIEVKGTDRPGLRGHFFSISENQIRAAVRLGPSRYRFVLVFALSAKPYHEEYSWSQLKARIRSKTIQWSVGF